MLVCKNKIKIYLKDTKKTVSGPVTGVNKFKNRLFMLTKETNPLL